MEYWLSIIDNPMYKGEPLEDNDFSLHTSKESAINDIYHTICNLHRRERIEEVNNATVEWLNSETVKNIILSALEKNKTVKVNNISFHIVKPSLLYFKGDLT